MKKKTIRSLAVLMAGVLTAVGSGGWNGADRVNAAEEWISDESLNGETAAPEKDKVLPSAGQLAYQRDGLSAFMHFGPNTFNEIEWGEKYGNDVSEIFKNMPDNFSFDADSYVKMVKEAGFKRLIVTAKHHDGFCIWQSEYTDFDMGALTKYKDGKGDFLEEVSTACTKYDIDMGLYLSPWDIHEPSYGDQSDGDYNDFYVNQLEEILGNDKYGNKGKFVEVWMDGAKGSGSQYQTYDTGRWADTIKGLEGEDCLLMQCNEDTDVRWIGNENGYAADETWALVFDKSGQSGYNNPAHNQNYDDNISGGYSKGYPNGDMWVVPEADARITSGWFWGNNKKTPKSLENLIDMYVNSIGHNATFLLNIPPNTSGTVDADIKARVLEFGTAVQNAFDENLATSELATAKADSVYGNDRDYSPNNVLDGNDDTFWAPADGKGTASLLVSFKTPTKFNVVAIEEAIQNGQRIESFTVEYRTSANGQWQPFDSGATIGSKRLARGLEVTATDIKITVDSYDDKLPEISAVEVYNAGSAFGETPVVLTGLTAVDNKQMTTTGSWINETITACHESTSMYTNTGGASASFEFTGGRFFIYGTKDPNHGTARISVDGKEVAAVNTKTTSRDTTALLYASDTLTYGKHTVTVTAAGDGAVGLDAAGYLDNNGAGMINFETTALTMEEDDQYQLGIHRVGGSSGKVSVTVNFEPGTAVQNFFDTNAQTVVFEDGETYKEATVTTKRVTGNATGADKGDTSFTVSMDIAGTDSGNNAIKGENSLVTVTIKDAETHHKNTDELKELIKKADVPNTGYTNESYEALTKALEAAKAVEDHAGVDAILKAYKDLNAAYNALERTGGIALPTKIGETVTIEAEVGAVVNDTSDDKGWPAKVADFAWASGGKGVDALKSLDTVSYYLDVKKAGTYEVTLSYRSGNTANSIVYTSKPEGNIVAGSASAGAASVDEGTKEAVFTLEITKPGLVEWIIRGGEKEAPQMDKFEISLKEIVEQDYIITASAGENGSITPDGEVTVAAGADQTFAITPDAGYKVKDVKVNGTSVGAVSAYTFEDVSEDAAITAEFEFEKYTQDNRFRFPAEEGTTVTLEAEHVSEIVNDTSNDNGWPCKVTEADWASGGKFVDAINTGDVLKYEYDAPVSGTYKVTATYKSGSTTNQLSWSSDPEGKIQSGTVDAGASSTEGAPKTAEFEIVVTEAGEGTWVFTGPAGRSPQLDKFDITLKEATSPAPEKYTITAAAGEGGTITPEGAVSVEEGKEQSFTVKAADGYVIENVTVDGQAVQDAAGKKEYTYTFENVAADAAINASFVKEQTEPEPSEVDRTVLKEALDKAADILAQTDKYTEESLAAYKGAVDAAQDVYDRTDASQEEIDQAAADLAAAENLLAEKTPGTTDPDDDKPGTTDPGADKPGTGSGSDKPGTGSGSADKAVQTGDSTNVFLWAAILGLLFGAGAVTVTAKRREKR